jgi:maleylpyruvate isomerase
VSAQPPATAAGYYVRTKRVTEALLAQSAQLADSDARAPSLLPGWCRGHVLSHLARNADASRHLLSWARTGVESPEYPTPSPDPYRAAVNAGATRTAQEIHDDLASSTAAFIAEFELMPTEAWTSTVRWAQGVLTPAWWVAEMRFRELVIHYVDLDIGYGPRDWPEDVVAEVLAEIMFFRPDVPSMKIRAEDTGLQLTARGAEDAQLEVRGPQHLLLAWLIGRAHGGGLSVVGGEHLPTPPGYG